MGFIGVLIIVGLFVVFLVIVIAISNLKYRATQHILKDTGLSSSDINANVIGSFEKKHLQKFLEENPSYTEESIKELLKQYVVQMISKNPIEGFSQQVSEKIQNDSKLEKLQNMQFRRVNVSRYTAPRLGALVVYADNRNEYNIYLNCSLVNGKVQLDQYTISKGAVVGF